MMLDLDTRRPTKAPKRDKQGRMRSAIGTKADGKRARFQVGDNETSPNEALRRIRLIHLLYEKQCEKLARSANEAGQPFTPKWQQWTYDIARRIGNGETIADTDFGDDSYPKKEWYRAGIVKALQEWGIPVEITEPKSIIEGVGQYKNDIGQLVAKLVQDELAKLTATHGPVIEAATESLPDPLEMDDTPLHVVIKHYQQYLIDNGDTDENGNLKQRVKKCRDRMGYFLTSVENMPLWRFDLNAIEAIAKTWRNRPETKYGNRCSKHHANDMAKEIKRFLKWLPKSPFNWQKPDGIDDITWKPIALPQDNSGKVFQTTKVETYTPEQLGCIAEQADNFGKALIAVCVNCAFGQSEIGQWPVAKFVFNQMHPHADKIGFSSTEEISLIVGERPKTQKAGYGNYGEHLLWPRVADAIKPFATDGREFFPVTGNGKPWYNTKSTNPQSYFGNRWNQWRNKAHENYPEMMGDKKLPFGSLRDTLPNVLRQKYNADLASLALQHQTPGEDRLLECYANLPFARFFEATKELEKFFEPLLEKL